MPTKMADPGGDNVVIHKNDLTNNLRCLALMNAIEAQNRSFASKVEVSRVTIRRTQFDGFADTPCGAIKEHHYVKAKHKTQYQYQWYRVMPEKVKIEKAEYLRSVKAARAAMIVEKIRHTKALFFVRSTLSCRVIGYPMKSYVIDRTRYCVPPKERV